MSHLSAVKLALLAGRGYRHLVTTVIITAAPRWAGLAAKPLVDYYYYYH